MEPHGLDTFGSGGRTFGSGGRTPGHCLTVRSWYCCWGACAAQRGSCFACTGGLTGSAACTPERGGRDPQKAVLPPDSIFITREPTRLGTAPATPPQRPIGFTAQHALEREDSRRQPHSQTLVSSPGSSTALAWGHWQCGRQIGNAGVGGASSPAQHSKRTGAYLGSGALWHDMLHVLWQGLEGGLGEGRDSSCCL